MVLEEICNADVYHLNAFYLLGISVDTTSKKIRRRQEDLDGFSEMGQKSWDKEFDKYLLGNASAPKSDKTRSLSDRLKEDPEFFVTEMFFWFWPLTKTNDPALTAIASGRRDEAVSLWRESMNRTGDVGLIARHNLAIALHYYAIDGEKDLQSHNYGESSEYRSLIDGFWKASFNLWEDLSDDDSFWDLFSERVAQLNDPRLDEVFIDSFREKFPVCFDNINADFLIRYVDADNMSAAKRHLDYITSTMSGLDDVEDTIALAFKPMVDKVRVLIKKCQNAEKPQEVITECEGIVAKSQKLISALQKLVPEGNSFTINILNDIVSTVDNKLPCYSRETGDYKRCLTLTKKLLPIAATPLMKEKITKAIEEWQDLIAKDKEAGTCVVCGKYIGKKIHLEEVKLHRDVRRDPTMYGRYEWRTRTVKVPVCDSCVKTFKSANHYASKFSAVDKSILDGWKIGEKPSQSEIDALGFI